LASAAMTALKTDPETRHCRRTISTLDLAMDLLCLEMGFAELIETV
jgi:hypothetical protein